MVGFDPYTDLANRRYRPLSHVSPAQLRWLIVRQRAHIFKQTLRESEGSGAARGVRIAALQTAKSTENFA